MPRLIVEGGCRFFVDPPWTPSLVNPIGWYDASDDSSITEVAGDVSLWTDKSSYGNDLIQNTNDQKPLYGDVGKQINGLNTVYFYRLERIESATLPDINLDATQGISIITVGAWIPTTYPLCEVVTIKSTDNSDNMVFRKDSGHDSMNISFTGDGVNSNWPRTKVSDSSLLAPNPWIATLFYDGSSKNVWSNGGTFKSSKAEPSISVFTVNKIGLGKISGNNCDNTIGETVIIPTSDLATRQKVEGYLAHKWGLLAELEVSHPYKVDYPT